MTRLSSFGISDMMRPKFTPVLEQAIEKGVRYGYRRAFKYNETPSEDEICNEVGEQVLNAIYDAFDFDDET